MIGNSGWHNSDDVDRARRDDGRTKTWSWQGATNSTIFKHYWQSKIQVTIHRSYKVLIMLKSHFLRSGGQEWQSWGNSWQTLPVRRSLQCTGCTTLLKDPVWKWNIFTTQYGHLDRERSNLSWRWRSWATTARSWRRGRTSTWRCTRARSASTSSTPSAASPAHSRWLILFGCFEMCISQVVVGNNQGECSTDVDVNIMDKPPEVGWSQIR